jgi:hypothetical protein
MPSPAETWSKCAPTRMTSSVCPRSVQIKFGGAFFLTICSEINSPVQPLCAKSFFRASFRSSSLALPGILLSRSSIVERSMMRSESVRPHLHVNDAPKTPASKLRHSSPHGYARGAFRPSISCSAPV